MEINKRINMHDKLVITFRDDKKVQRIINKEKGLTIKAQICF